MADLHDLHEAGGVSIQTVDGADVSDVVVERVRIMHARGPISVRRGARGAANPNRGPASCVASCSATSRRRARGKPRRSRAYAGIRSRTSRSNASGSTLLGGGAAVHEPVPEREDAYPQCTMFGRLPAWGLYARHVRGLALRDVELTARSPDEREMLVLDDVTRVD